MGNNLEFAGKVALITGGNSGIGAATARRGSEWETPSAGLDEQTAVNRFVGHAHALVNGILDLQPSRNLFWRPVQNQFTRNQLPQLRVDGQKAALGPQG